MKYNLTPTSWIILKPQQIRNYSFKEIGKGIGHCFSISNLFWFVMAKVLKKFFSVTYSKTSYLNVNSSSIHDLCVKWKQPAIILCKAALLYLKSTVQFNPALSSAPRMRTDSMDFIGQLFFSINSKYPSLNFKGRHCLIILWAVFKYWKCYYKALTC